ncbi:MAG: AraC family transcriptional regulator [gamma proteobacterium symbiont of Taylorina sp.]|nr:AraC family transcriptional regulator [gamma proteobacterium symbiont of Taylorina sp.]
MENTFYPPILELFWKLFAAQGINPEKIFKPNCINIKELKISDSRIKTSTVDQLWKDAEELIGNGYFALDSYKYWHPGCLGALGYAWLSSSTLREGFQRLVRYFKVLNSEAGMKIEEINDEVIISYEKQYSVGRSASALSLLMHMCRINYQEHLAPKKVTLWHPEPEDISKYYAYFQCPVEFNTGVDSVIFPVNIVDKELSGGNEQLAKLNDQVLIKYLNTLTQDNLIVRIKSIIVRELPSGNVSNNRVAEELYTSTRSLQRKLKVLGTTFKKVYEECRKDLAEQYVADGKMSLTEISFILGFTEISSFSRSYKRWTGHSPNADRQM